MSYYCSYCGQLLNDGDFHACVGATIKHDLEIKELQKRIENLEIRVSELERRRIKK